MRAARRRQCFCRRVIYVWLQNIWGDAGGVQKWHLCLQSSKFLLIVPHVLTQFSLFVCFHILSLPLHCRCGLFLICVIPELLLERQLAVWCSSLLIINASFQRGLHKACQPIRTGFISCTTLFLRTLAQGRAGDPGKSQHQDQLHALRHFQRFRGGRQSFFLLHKHTNISAALQPFGRADFLCWTRKKWSRLIEELGKCVNDATSISLRFQTCAPGGQTFNGF